MPDRPNILFLMPDQLRADFLSCYGAEFVDTPNIDALAAGGVTFTDAHSEHPLCVPARVSLLTGHHGVATGVLGNGYFLRPDHNECGMPIWPETLGEAGYHTAAMGKMHFYPWDLRLGFERRVIAEDKRWIHIRDDYWRSLHAAGLKKYHGMEHEGYLENKGAVISQVPWEHTVDHFVGAETCKFIREYGSEGPFAMMVGFPGPHCPYDPTPEYLKGIDPEDMPLPAPIGPGDATKLRERAWASNRLPWNGVDYAEFTLAQMLKVRAHYAGLVRQIDHEIGEIMAALRETGQLDNTYIILSADHGDYLGDHGMVGKSEFYCGCTHVPMIVSGPGLPQCEQRDDLVCLTDVTATMLTMANVARPASAYSRPLPGLGLGEDEPRQHLIGAAASGYMVDDGAWRLSRYGTGEATLYNRRDDPMEQVNLIGDPNASDAVQRLGGALTSALMEQMLLSHHSRQVYSCSLSQELGFGLEGWRRVWPCSLPESKA